MPLVQPMVASLELVRSFVRTTMCLRASREAVLESLAGSTAMPFIDTSALEVIERLPGWYGRYFHSPSMTFAHYDFKRDSSIHEHFHEQDNSRMRG